MSELLTTKEIAQIYKVSEYTVTQSWIPKGLKYFPCMPFKFKLEWVEEFIERQAEEAFLKRQNKMQTCEVVNNPKRKNIPKFHDDMRIRMEDFFPI